MKRKSIKNLILCTSSILILTLSYHRDFFGVVDLNTFQDFDVYCESQVIGRVIRSEKEGIFSEGGLNGWVKDDSVMKNMTWDDMTHFQFDIYKKGVKLGPAQFIIYDSQLGGQGMLFALLDKISPLGNTINLNIFWFLNSLLMASLVTVFLFWVKKYYGSTSAFITFLLLFLSPWLTSYGKDLYLVIWSFYFPFILLLLKLHNESEGKIRISTIKLFALSIGLVFLKLFFSGFEFITSALVMFTIPLFYYFFLERWKIKLFMKRFISVASGAFSAIIIYVVLYSYQISTLKGNMSTGIKYIIYSFLKRTYGNSADFPEGFKASLDASVLTVLKMYLKTEAFRFGLFKVTMSMIIIGLIIISLIIIYSAKFSPSTHLKRAVNFPLMMATWVSILGPLSWYVIFKAHSYVHLSIDELVWYMPFCFFAFTLVGSILPTLIKDINTFFDTHKQTHTL